MAGCSLGSVLWLDEWFALDIATGSRASRWVLPMTRALRTQGFRFLRVNTRVTVVGSDDVDVAFESNSNSEAASPIVLNGGTPSPSGWNSVGTVIAATCTIQVDSQEISSEDGLRDLVRVAAVNNSVSVPAQVRVEIWVTLGS